jgi:hypothetical protein
MDDASMLTDRDERAIETIRRQLDRESPPTPRGVAFAWDVDTHAAAAVVPPPRRTGRVAVVIGALLVAFTLGAGVGAVVATLLLRDAPLGVEPDGRRPAALTPPPAPAPPKPRPVTSSPPRPSRASPRVAPPPAEEALRPPPPVPPAPSVERGLSTGRAAVDEARTGRAPEPRAPESP